MMIDIYFPLNYATFDEVKNYTTDYDIWIYKKDVYGEYDSIRRDKAKSLRGQFDQIKMREYEKFAMYNHRIKAMVFAINASRGMIEDETLVSKFLKTILPTYAIRMSTIQEMRCDPINKITLDALLGRLTPFELDNYDNYIPSYRNLESTFEAKVSFKKKAKNNK